MTLPSPRDAIEAALKLALIGAAFAAVYLIFTRVIFSPRPDPLPAQLARTDEKTATRAATAVATDVAQRTADATLHLDLTTRDIADAFAHLPAPQPTPAADAEPRPLPAAPVDRVRDRLNEGISRANGAAGAAGAPD